MSDKQGFNFRWGIPWLDDKNYIEIPGFIKRNYAKLGVKPLEMMMNILAPLSHASSMTLFTIAAGTAMIVRSGG